MRGAAGLVGRFAPRNDVNPRHCERSEAIQHTEEDGFTLVELMVVIVIIGLLATIVVINVMPAADRAAVTKARADIATLEQGIDLYHLNNRRYPTSEEGLQALVAQNLVRRLPNDPWNNPYRYSAPGRNGAPYTIMTWGADGREGGDGENEDLSN
jgi:general secretion pathway protein G